MEDKKLKITASAAVIILLIVVIVIRLTLGPSRLFLKIAGFGFAAIFSILAWMIARCTLNRRKDSTVRQLDEEGEQLRIEYSFLRKVAGLPTKFRYEDLEVATDNFQYLLGQGSSGSVFKGILDDGTHVAVKRIDGSEYGEKEFRAEVSAIASVQHVNLVRLLGYCVAPARQRLLVYEFVLNGSLDTWIFPSTGTEARHREACLPWDLRFRVAIDVSKALAYLHHDCRARILHLDVKPENILLDENFRGCVSDFGLSRLMSKDESRVVTTVRGTRGYLAPEWLLDNGISEKTDIYSYGMVLLELVGGRRNVCLVGDGQNTDRKWSYFPKIVSEKVREGKLMEVVDERLLENGGVEERQLRLLVYVALWCIQEKAELRPSMARVADMLEGRVHVDVPPETSMIIVDLLSVVDQQSLTCPVRANGSMLAPRENQTQLGSTSACSFTMSVMSALSAR